AGLRQGEGAVSGEEPTSSVVVRPGGGAVLVAGDRPRVVGLGEVVSPAERGEVLGVGLAGWAAGVVGGDVVEVAGPGAVVAVRELAVLVAHPHLGGHPLGWVVPVDGVVAVHVDDGGDGGGGAVAGEPVAELLDEDGAEPVGAGQGQTR